MGKYSAYNRSTPRKPPKQIHPIWRGLGFLLMIGVPVLPPYYSLRLLPYVVPQIATWKRRMLREKDVVDTMF